jgi:hypothetical protein
MRPTFELIRIKAPPLGMRALCSSRAIFRIPFMRDLPAVANIRKTTKLPGISDQTGSCGIAMDLLDPLRADGVAAV